MYSWVQEHICARNDSIGYVASLTLTYLLTHSLTHKGWGGDTGPIMYNTIKAIQNNRPMEIAPVKLGKRTMPPHYEGYHGLLTCLCTHLFTH